MEMVVDFPGGARVDAHFGPYTIMTEFPDKYYNALVRSAEQCAVKKHMEQPPEFNVHTTVVG